MAQVLAMTTPRSARQTQRTEAKKVTPLVSVVSGAVAGASEAAITYPFEFAKTRLQLRASAATQTLNPLALIRHTVAEAGIGALYVGCSTLVVGTALKAGVRFMSFDTIKNQLSDSSGHLTATQSLFAGMVAGAVESVAAVTPTERIKTAMIDDARGAKRYRSSVHAAGMLVKEQGITTLYKGLSSTTLKQCTTSAVRMGSYNMLKQMWQKSGMPQNSIATFGLGAIAGIITVYATQPFDTIKSRTQSAKGATTLEAAASIWTDAGLRGLWKGSTMRLGRLARVLLPKGAGQVLEANQRLAAEGQDGAGVGWVTAGKGWRVSRSHGRGAAVGRGTKGLLCAQSHQGPKQVEVVPATGSVYSLKCFSRRTAYGFHGGDVRKFNRLRLDARHSLRASTVCSVREDGASGGDPIILMARVTMVPIPRTA
ncbi:mitochondrial carrier domain-containing protein, partial [Chaetomium tenue]